MQNNGMQGSTSGASAETIADRASAGLSRISDTAQETMGRVGEYASQTAGRLSERGHDLMEMQGRAFEQARGYVREHPVAAIGIAIAVGLIISRLTSRR